MKRFSILLSLALAALTLLAAGTPAHAGERPIQAEGRGFLDLDRELSPKLRGTGEGDHLGRCGLLIFLDLDLGNDHLIPRHFCWLQAANNDLLYAALDLEFDPVTGIIAGTITFTGGTGRFADASGSALLLIVPDTYWFDYGGAPIRRTQFSWALEGTIDY
jgi:hypothetical protein